MTRILVYDEESGQIEKFQLPDTDTMPYVTPGLLTVKDFKAGSESPIVWTTMDTLSHINDTFVGPFTPKVGFSRLYESAHREHQHYAGTALEVTHTPVAQDMPLWNYAALTSDGLLLHMGQKGDEEYAFYPTVSKGDTGVYVMVLQDGLNLLGYTPGDVDGLFGDETERALKAFQKDMGLKPDGVAGVNTWNVLFLKTLNQPLG